MSSKSAIVLGTCVFLQFSFPPLPLISLMTMAVAVAAPTLLSNKLWPMPPLLKYKTLQESIRYESIQPIRIKPETKSQKMWKAARENLPVEGVEGKWQYDGLSRSLPVDNCCSLFEFTLIGIELKVRRRRRWRRRRRVGSSFQATVEMQNGSC